MISFTTGEMRMLTKARNVEGYVNMNQKIYLQPPLHAVHNQSLTQKQKRKSTSKAKPRSTAISKAKTKLKSETKCIPKSKAKTHSKPRPKSNKSRPILNSD